MDFERDHPLRELFAEKLHTLLDRHVGLPDEQVETYLTDLMIAFLHRDRMYAIRDSQGRVVESVTAMLAEGDVRQNAASFERERQVHKHIGDFLLFCGGMFPEILQGQSIDVDDQGRESYYIASTFRHSPYEAEASLFAKLSAEFPAYRFGLKLVRDSLGP